MSTPEIRESVNAYYQYQEDEINYKKQDKTTEIQNDAHDEATDIQEQENEIAEMTSIVEHCTTTKDCYKIFRDRTVECVLPRNHKALDQANNSLRICERKGCERNNDNCYLGELCIKNRCVPVSEVRTVTI